MFERTMSLLAEVMMKSLKQNASLKGNRRGGDAPALSGHRFARVLTVVPTYIYIYIYMYTHIA